MNSEFDEFDKEVRDAMRRTERNVWIAFIVIGAVGLALLGSIGWVAYSVLQHFGVI